MVVALGIPSGPCRAADLADDAAHGSTLALLAKMELDEKLAMLHSADKEFDDGWL